MNEELSATEL